MNESTITFQAIIMQHEDMDAGFIAIPVDIAAKLGAKYRSKVKAKFDGIEYRGSLAKMKSNNLLLGVRKNIRTEIAKSFGDTIEVQIALDTEPRIIELPQDVIEIFEAHPQAKARFDKLSYTHQKEHINAINDAKKIETRNKRMIKMIDMLLK